MGNTMFIESHPSLLPLGWEEKLLPANALCQKVSTLEDIRRATKARRRFILRRPLEYHAFLSETTVKTTGGEGAGGGNHLLSRLTYMLAFCRFDRRIFHLKRPVQYPRYSNAYLGMIKIRVFSRR